MDDIDVFEKEYSDECLYDLCRDVSEAVDPKYNPVIKDIPDMKDCEGFRRGYFTVKITWKDDEDS